MLRSIKRWFRRPRGVNAPGLDIWVDWAERRGLTLRPVREQVGLVIEGKGPQGPWRLEWGPSQRSYVKGFELRFRAELSCGPELQLLVISRQLQEAMERAVYHQYVESVQTRMEESTPPEMRWLVMFPKLSGLELGRLKDNFAAVGNHKAWLMQWLKGPLEAALASPSLPLDQPMVLMIGRGRIVLRMPMDQPDEQRLDIWMRLFEIALREAGRVVGDPETAASAPPSLI